MQINRIFAAPFHDPSAMNESQNIEYKSIWKDVKPTHSQKEMFNSAFPKIVLYLILLLSSTDNLFAQNTDFCGILSLIDTPNSKVSYSKSAIPASVKRIIAKEEKFGNPFRISNPQRKYRSNDVVTNHLLPNNRLVFLIRSNNYCVLLFEHGGRGKCTYCVVVDVKDKESISKVVPKNSVSSYEDFVSFLRYSCKNE